jgi:hypothetical protein
MAEMKKNITSLLNFFFSIVTFGDGYVGVSFQ